MTNQTEIEKVELTEDERKQLADASVNLLNTITHISYKRYPKDTLKWRLLYEELLLATITNLADASLMSWNKFTKFMAEHEQP